MKSTECDFSKQLKVLYSNKENCFAEKSANIQICPIFNTIIRETVDFTTKYTFD